MCCEPFSDHEKAYGYLQVKTGSEKKTADIINTIFPEIESYAITQIKHKSCKGFRSYSSSVMVPGYILFRANQDMRVSQLQTVGSVYQVLTYDHQRWQLRTRIYFAPNGFLITMEPLAYRLYLWKAMQ